MLREWLKAEISRYDDKPVIVWYDPGGTLQPLVDEALFSPRRLLPFGGSYLALRIMLETTDPSFGEQWLVYIPESPPPQSWLRDWELFGVWLELDFLELLRKAAGLSVDQELRELFRGARTASARALAGSWEVAMGTQPVTKESLVRALLALAFSLPGFEVKEAVIRFLSGQSFGEALEKHGLFPFWRRLLEEDLGFSTLPDDPDTLRRRLAAAILLTELVEKSGQLADAFPALLPDTARRRLVATIARTWRENLSYQDTYKEAAREIEREYRIGERLNVDERLVGVETFLAVDELFLREAEALAGTGGSRFTENKEKLARVATERKTLFWARAGEAPYWEPISLAAKLYGSCAAALEALPGYRRVADLVAAYTAPAGWWRLDSWALKLAAVPGRLTAEQQGRFLAPALRLYREYVDLAAKRLAELVREEGWPPDQVKFWSDTVRAVPGCTAILFIDALRFDLAFYLKELLEGSREFGVTLNWRKASLPSITEVGMAALLPGTERGLSLGVEDRFSLSIGSENVTGSNRRRDYLRNTLGRSGRVLSLEEAEGLPSLPSGTSHLVVLWDGIDDFGTFTADLSPGTFLELVERIRRVVQHLGRLGCTKVLITADHGFLFIPAVAGAPVRLEAPAGERVVVKHRFAAGSFRATTGTLEIEGHRLGWPGDTLFAFPAGYSIFGLPGETPVFFHGGLSLQEAVIPVLAIDAAVTWKVGVKMVLPERISSATVRIRLLAEPRTVFDAPRRVAVEVTGPGIRKTSEAVKISVQTPEVPLSITWSSGLLAAETPPEKLTFKLIDVDTQELLGEPCEVPVVLLFT